MYDTTVPPAGGVQETNTDALPAAAVTAVGAEGTAGGDGVTAFEGAEGELAPAALPAVTLKV